MTGIVIVLIICANDKNFDWYIYLSYNVNEHIWNFQKWRGGAVFEMGRGVLAPPWSISKSLQNKEHWSFGTSFKFHSNLLFISKKTKFFPSFYRQIILNWKKCLAMITELPSCILSQYLWYNRSIQVDNSSVYFLTFSGKKYQLCFPTF